MYDVVVKKFTFAVSSRDELLVAIAYVAVITTGVMLAKYSWINNCND